MVSAVPSPVVTREIILASALALPLQIGGLVGWYRADSGLYQLAAPPSAPAVADGDPVGRWADLSGYGMDLTQPTGSKRPLLKLNKINGHPALLFDGVSQFLQSAFVGNLFTPTTIVAVLSQVTWTSSHRLCDGGPGGGTMELIQSGTTPTLEGFAGGTGVVATSALALGTYAVVGMRFDDVRSALFLNGANVGTFSGTWGNNSPKGLTLGATTTGTFPGNCVIGEFLLYGRSLPDQAIQALTQYLDTNPSLPWKVY